MELLIECLGQIQNIWWEKLYFALRYIVIFSLGNCAQRSFRGASLQATRNSGTSSRQLYSGDSLSNSRLACFSFQFKYQVLNKYLSKYSGFVSW